MALTATLVTIPAGGITRSNALIRSQGGAYAGYAEVDADGVVTGSYLGLGVIENSNIGFSSATNDRTDEEGNVVQFSGAKTLNMTITTLQADPVSILVGADLDDKKVQVLKLMNRKPYAVTGGSAYDFTLLPLANSQFNGAIAGVDPSLEYGFNALATDTATSLTLSEYDSVFSFLDLSSLTTPIAIPAGTKIAFIQVVDDGL